jgi:hypothetical protein
LNPIRAGLCKRPEEWKESSACLRWLGQDRYLLALEEIFPETPRHQIYADYRAGLLYRGMNPSKATQRVMDPEVVGIEQASGFARPGLYRKRLRFLTGGLVLGTADRIQDHLDRLRAKGVYRRRRHPIPQLDGLFFTLREQRGHTRC